MEVYQLRNIHKRLLKNNPGNIQIDKKYGGRSIVSAVIKDREAVMVFVINIDDDYKDAKDKEKRIIEFAEKTML